MDDLSSSRPFDGLSSLYRSFSRRPRPAPGRPAGPSFVAIAPPTNVTAAHQAESHRTLAREQTKEAIDHFLALNRRHVEARRRQEIQRRAGQDPSPYNRSRIAMDEAQGWDRWVKVIHEALQAAEEGIVAAIRAWQESGRPPEGTEEMVRGVIHQGRLYLVVNAGEGGKPKLVVADLRSSLNLDGSLAVVDLVSLAHG